MKQASLAFGHGARGVGIGLSEQPGAKLGLPDAPAGIKGSSLFVVPKFLPDASGEPGQRNSVSCASIENKMGIKASATCVMNFDGAKGWLVGEPHKGMQAMFTMMNDARLGVGMQGLGLAESAQQAAVDISDFPCRQHLHIADKSKGSDCYGPLAVLMERVFQSSGCFWMGHSMSVKNSARKRNTMKVKMIATAIALSAAFLVAGPNIAEDSGNAGAASPGTDKYSMSMDFDSSGEFNIGDVSALLYWLFRGGSAPDCSDAMDYNQNGRINVIDVVSGLRYLFTYTHRLPARGAGCQVYPGCDASAACQ